MNYYKDGNRCIATIGVLDLEPITKEQYVAAEEETAKRQEAQGELYERTRPLTMEEVSRMIITRQINSLTVDDSTALRMKEFYPEWKDLTGTTVNMAGFKFTHDGDLYKTIPEQHTFQADWVPGEGTESIYTRIDETHAGTLSDPIPYEGNMALEAGKYYSQDGAVYLCTRDTVDPVYSALAGLAGLYVERV